MVVWEIPYFGLVKYYTLARLLPFQPHRTRVSLHITMSLAFKRNRGCFICQRNIQQADGAWSKYTNFKRVNFSFPFKVAELFCLKLITHRPEHVPNESVWFQVALRALSCMEHRGACSGGMDSTTASWMTQMNPARLPSRAENQGQWWGFFPGWPALSWGIKPLCEEGTLTRYIQGVGSNLWTYVERYTYTHIYIFVFIYILYMYL